MATALVEYTENGFTARQVDLIKQQIAPGIDDGNLRLFGLICQRTGLDPFLKQIYTIRRGDKWTIQTGIDGYRLLAARTGELAGIDDATYDTEDEDHPNKATVTVWRFVASVRCPFSATARWSEYKPGPPNDKMWGKMPYLMLGKCAEALALRKAFPAELAGIYTGEEMDQADVLPPQTVRNTAGQRVNTDTGEIARSTGLDDPWAEVRNLARRLALSDAEREAIFKRHKKNRDAILADLRERLAGQEAVETLPAESEPEHELAGAFGTRGV